MLEELKEYAKENFVPIVRPKTCELLIDKIKKVNPKHILEVGTAIGFSGILMLQNSNAELVTLEKNEEMFKMASNNFEKANLTHRVKIVLGDCKEYIEKMPQKFDFIFLDGPKSHYVEYLPYLLQMLNENGLIFADNVLFQGLVQGNEIAPKKVRTIVNNLREFISVVKADSNLNLELLDMEDGVALITKK